MDPRQEQLARTAKAMTREGLIASLVHAANAWRREPWEHWAKHDLEQAIDALARHDALAEHG